MSKRILVIFAHPRFEASNVNKQLVEQFLGMPEVTVRDLYELYPDYQIDVQAEQKEILQHDIIIWHHPLYWYSAPPMLKLWIDEVLEFNWAYGPRGVFLKGKIVMNLITAGGSAKAYQATGSNHYSIREFLRPFEQTARLCHMSYLPPFAVLNSYRQTSKALQQYKDHLRSLLEAFQQKNFDPASYKDALFMNEQAELLNPLNK
ncbi:MAG: glutathione-regulated potassium-efflux system ancillary protein KefG [Cyclobacteriaceae bacterium]|jgi:glutathione-regulated potassium-efflux system ancillary protein KefG